MGFHALPVASTLVQGLWEAIRKLATDLMFPIVHTVAHTVASNDGLYDFSNSLCECSCSCAYGGKDCILCLERIFGYGGALYLGTVTVAEMMDDDGGTVEMTVEMNGNNGGNNGGDRTRRQANRNGG